MSYIAGYDFALLLFYLAIFYIVAKILSVKCVEPTLRKIFMNAFWLRMLGSVCYSLITQYYYGYGDSFTYFKGSNFFTDGISDNLSNIRYLFAPIEAVTAWYNASPAYEDLYAGYFRNPSNNMVMKISAILSYFSFNRFLIVSLFFAFFSFWGQWKLFQVFDDINKSKNRRMLAIATLYTPSIWFWGSGLLKDSICLGAVGMIVNILYKMMAKKQVEIKNILLVLALVYLVMTIKFYIIAVLFISFGLTMFMVFLKSIKEVIFKITIIAFFLLISFFVLSAIDFAEQLNSMVGDAVSQIESFKSSYESMNMDDERSKGAFSIGDLDPSLGGLISRSPSVIFSCLYRPFLWESRKLVILFTSLESTLLLLFTIYVLFKLKFIGFFKALISNQYVFFCFVTSILFALLIGFTTFNFGTMIRYKIIFLPFFYFLHVKLLSDSRASNISG